VLRLPSLRKGGALILLLGVWNGGEMPVLSLYFQQVLHDSPLMTGLAIAPQGIVGFAAGALGARLAARMGTRWLLVLTNGVATFGFLALTHLPATGGVINTSRQIGAGIGAALLPAIAITASHGGGTAGVGGDRAAMLAGAVTAGLATLVAWRSRGMDAASEHDSQRT